MPHWMDKVVVLLTTNTADLRKLALMAGGNPRTFYRGIKLEDLEIARQDDIWGMEFGEITEADIANAETMSALARREVFITTQTISMRDTIDEITFSYYIDYPSFKGAAEFTSVNDRFVDEAKRAAIAATPPKSGNHNKLGWSYKQRFAIYVPSADAVTVAFDFHGYSGGAHGYGARTCTLVDVHAGKIIGPEDVFAAESRWLDHLVDFVTADLKLQFIDRPGYDNALDPDNLRKFLSKSEYYCWQDNKLVLVFNSYDIAAYAAGPYSVEISYEDLRWLLRPNWGLSRD